MYKFISRLKKIFYKYTIDPEVADAHYHKLPDNITVGWFRDGKFIIGKIKAEGHEYMTQAISAKEFVQMVNDTIFAVYEIPEKYFFNKFEPSKEEFGELNDNVIKKSEMVLNEKLVMV